MPTWALTIYGIATLHDRYDSHEIEFTEMRDRVVAILKAKLKRYLDYDHAMYDMTLEETIEELCEVDTVDYYDTVKAGLYDWCDTNRVWIDPSR